MRSPAWFEVMRSNVYEMLGSSRWAAHVTPAELAPTHRTAIVLLQEQATELAKNVDELTRLNEDLAKAIEELRGERA